MTDKKFIKQLKENAKECTRLKDCKCENCKVMRKLNKKY